MVRLSELAALEPFLPRTVKPADADNASVSHRAPSRMH